KGEAKLYLRRIDELEARPLPGTEGGSYPFWSPDSTMIGFQSGDRKLKKIAAAGGPPQTLCDASNMKGGSWGPDGTILFAPLYNSGISRVPDIGGEPEKLTEPDETKGETSHRFPWFLPDGKHFLFVVRSAGKANSLRVGSLGTDEVRVLGTSDTNADYASGHILFLKDRTLMAQAFDPDRLELRGGAFPIAENIRYVQNAALGVFSTSQNGVLAYLQGGSDQGRELTWVDREGKIVGKVGEPAAYSDVRISPDGKNIAAAVEDQNTAGRDIWIVEVARGIRTRFTFDPAEDFNPIWSPDGRRIAFTSMRTGPRTLFVKSLDGTGGAEPLTTPGPGMTASDWSPDGKTLLCTSSPQKETKADIWAVPVDGGEPKAIVATQAMELQAVFSPDGHWIAYRSDESGFAEIYASPFPGPGRKWQISTDHGWDPRWLASGEILYDDQEGMIQSVKVTEERDSLKVDRPAPLGSTVQGGYDATTDGRRILVITSPEPESPLPLTLVVNWTAALQDHEQR
ncbi:MAG TPA: hypothetical protein VNI57_01545, partial [Candidatus Saccharimonadales bacterium]|nr:hypothetical protein [Candidatus Saccharimonadales bacterium]